MPLQATSGAASYDAFGGGVPVVPNYIEDVFNVWLHTGSSSSNQTITNGIDLAGKGGLVWQKGRNTAFNHAVFDSGRSLGLGTASMLNTNTTNAEATGNSMRFDSTGFTMGVSDDAAQWASWTFRKQPKFFDVVTYTGTGSARTVAHNLGSVPGCILIKSTNSTDNWAVYHRSIGNTGALVLNTTAATDTFYGYWNNTSPTSTQFTVNIDLSVNGSGQTYVAYLFAHDAGGFGLTGTDNVISCGSYTGNGSTQDISLGYEPQWILIKPSSASGSWYIVDSMRGATANDGVSNTRALLTNDATAEFGTAGSYPTATGFRLGATNNNGSGVTYIYIAIRRGPMKVPTVGTSVYNAVSRTGTGTDATITGIGFAPDLLDNQRTTAGSYTGFFDRLRGGGKLLYRALDDPETTVTGQTTQFNTTMDGFAVGTSTASDSGNNNTVPYIWHCFKRAPSVFDIVCWTRSTTTATLNHNLGVVPELIIKKDRSKVGTYWDVMPNVSPYDYRYDIYLNDTQAISGPSSIYWNAAPTATTFDVHMGFDGSSNGDTFVAYLFATCAGVSKVTSFTGNGSSQTINCGFTGGARLVLIKRTDSTGDWYIWDSARGIVSGNDPHLSLNSTAAEVTTDDTIDTDSTGFIVNQVSATNCNVNGANYIVLAVA